MPIIKFLSLDKENRTVLFDVDSNQVTRKIPAQLLGTVDEYIEALADGLLIEACCMEKAAIAETKFVEGQVLREMKVAEKKDILME